MPRAKIDPAEKIAQLDAKIEKYTEMLSRLKAQRKQLAAKHAAAQKKAQLQQVYELMQQSGKSPEELAQLLQTQ